MSLYFPENYKEAAERAAAQTEFPHNLVLTGVKRNRGKWVVLTWGSMSARWDNWGSIATLKRALAYCDGKFARGGSPVRLVRVTRDGRMTRVVDPFA